MAMTGTSVSSMEASTMSMALPSMEAPTIPMALPAMEAPIPMALPAMALPSVIGSMDHQTWTSILEAGRRAAAAEDLSTSLWKEIERLRFENEGLSAELQKCNANLQMSISNWQQTAAGLDRSIKNNRNIQTAVVENLILREKVRTLEAARAQYEPHIPIHNQTQSGPLSQDDMSNEQVSYSGEGEDGATRDRKMANRANRP